MNCRLCLNNRKLCNSHIIPEFFYRDLYDDKRRLLVVSTGEGRRPFLRQKGFYEKLLCSDCEERINDFEQYVKRVFYDDPPLLCENDAGRRNKMTRLDYTKLKLFQLSVLWRASISSDAFFCEVQLGAHEEVVRRMLWDRNPGRPDEYGCSIGGLLLDDENASNDFIVQPMVGMDGRCRTIRFVFGSCMWLYLISPDTRRHSRSKYFVQKDGTMILEAAPSKANPFLQNLVQRLRESGELRDDDDENGVT